jgi:hypothetical protein
VRLSPLGTEATIGLLYQPQMIDEGNCEAIGGMKTGTGNRSTRRKPAPVPLCLPHIPHGVTWAWTGAAAMGSRRLTAWTMARLHCTFIICLLIRHVNRTGERNWPLRLLKFCRYKWKDNQFNDANLNRIWRAVVALKISSPWAVSSWMKRPCFPFA